MVKMLIKFILLTNRSSSNILRFLYICDEPKGFLNNPVVHISTRSKVKKSKSHASRGFCSLFSLQVVPRLSHDLQLNLS